MDKKTVYILEKRVTNLLSVPRTGSGNSVFTFFKVCASYEVGKRIAYKVLKELNEFDNTDDKPKIYGGGIDQYDMWWCEDSLGRVEIRGHEAEIGE